MPRFLVHCVCACLLLLGGTRSSLATWSICIADLETREVAVGTVTCLNGFDLLALVPVIVVEKGSAAVQSAGDFEGIRRPIIFEEFMNGTPPAEILAILSEMSGHQSRQFGIVDTQQRGVTFSGSQNGAWAGGRTFTIGSTIYAIQGNVLAGQCVIDAIDDAIHDIVETTGGDIPEQLMAGMEAAAAAGGDGRCSCSAGNTEGCGCPVEEFTKSGHIGGMVVARVGDVDDTLCNANGCVDGDYLMRLNVAFQDSGRPDPVIQLREQFDAWRADHEGRPDAVHSTAVFDPVFIPPNGVSMTTMTITLLDWRDLPIDVAIESFTVEHAAGSAGISSIGKVLDNGDGTFDVTMTAGTATGVDRFRVVVEDGTRPVTLTPEPRLEYFSFGDVDGSGAVDFGDILAVIASWGPCPDPPDPCPADLDGNGVVEFADVLIVLEHWSTLGACCFDDQTCTEISEYQCGDRGGVFVGEATTCDGSCPFGACCFGDGTCEEATDVRCRALGGAFQGEGSICEESLCQNDTCNGAILVGEGSFAYSNEEATIDEGPDLPAECDEGNGLRFRKDIWFRYAASCDGIATASVCDSTFDTRLAVYLDGDCPGPFLACNDDACGENGSRSEVSFPVQAGARYLIRVGSRFARGEGTLVIDCTE